MPETKNRQRGVLILVQNLPVPFDRRVWLEARALRDAGYQVSVICPKGVEATRSREILEDIHIFRYHLIEAKKSVLAYCVELAWCWLMTFFLAWRVYLTRGFKVIQACNPPDTFFAIAWCFRPWGVGFIFDQHDLCPEIYEAKYPQRQGDLMHRGLRLLERLTYRTADVVIATNESYKTMALTRGAVAPEKVFVVRNGPDAERIQEEAVDPQERWGADFVLGYLGTMAAQDGVDILLRIMHELVHQHARHDLHLVLVGSGPELESLKQLTTELGIADKVTFHGRVPNGPRFRRIFSSVDLCVCPDPPNTLNNVSTMNKTMEYMAFGRPVVAFALPETVVSGGDAAVYAPPGDEAALTREILALLDDPAKRQELGRRGRARVRECLAWPHSIPSLLAAYNCAFSEKARGSGRASRQRKTGRSTPTSSSRSNTN